MLSEYLPIGQESQWVELACAAKRPALHASHANPPMGADPFEHPVHDMPKAEIMWTGHFTQEVPFALGSFPNVQRSHRVAGNASAATPGPSAAQTSQPDAPRN